jgi:2-C-methyl-D-erythritol 4-phosphate cytidylyltransferase
MTVAALVLGAGRGERYRASLSGAAAQEAPPKALTLLRGRTLLARSITSLCSAPSVTRVVPVLPAELCVAWRERPDAGLAALSELAPAVAGGAERVDSTRAGLAALPAEVDLVAVHDAARPLVRPEDVERVVAAARETGAALLAVPARDTIHRVRDGLLAESPPREECWAAQTPQVFRRDWLDEALARAAAEGRTGTDEAALLRALGRPVRAVAGDPRNLKITTRDDLAVAETWLREAEGA